MRAADQIALSKDHLVLAMLAVLGGDRREIVERDLFLACWHAFPNAMRWADTALPNPDTFTASLRRLDADGLIVRVGKQARNQKRRRPTRKTVLDPSRSGMVKARLRQNALETAGIDPAQLQAVRELTTPADTYVALPTHVLILICIGAREGEGRSTDEGALMETAFHKFPAVFAYQHRPEFPDLQTVRAAMAEGQRRGLITNRLALTAEGRNELEAHRVIQLRLDASESQPTGAFRLAQRIESSPAYVAYEAAGKLAATKGDELFRTLRLPPTVDPRPIAAALSARAAELWRIDRGDLAKYLLKLAQAQQPEVLQLVDVQALADGGRSQAMGAEEA